MTREEAIKILQGAIKKPNTKDGYLGQALDMAIKALERKISIDNVKDEIEKQEKWLASAGYNAYNVDIALKSIKLALAESKVRE